MRNPPTNANPADAVLDAMWENRDTRGEPTPEDYEEMFRHFQAEQEHAYA